MTFFGLNTTDYALPAPGQDPNIIVSNERGTASFVQTNTGVTLSVRMTVCDTGQKYPIYIHEGNSCATAKAQGGRWNPPLGEIVGTVDCEAPGGVGLTYTRANTDPSGAWSVRSGQPNDVVGRVLVVFSPYGTQEVRALCGKIE